MSREKFPDLSFEKKDTKRVATPQALLSLPRPDPNSSIGDIVDWVGSGFAGLDDLVAESNARELVSISMPQRFALESAWKKCPAQGPDASDAPVQTTKVLTEPFLSQDGERYMRSLRNI